MNTIWIPAASAPMLSPSFGHISQRAADESLSSSQKSLSSMIEARVFTEFMANDQVEVHRKAHLVLNRNLGAGAWLTSLPATLIPTSSLFTASLRHRLRMAIWDEDSICPLCGQTQDR